MIKVSHIKPIKQSYLTATLNRIEPLKFHFDVQSSHQKSVGHHCQSPSRWEPTG